MTPYVTLILILHNRTQNMLRLMEYYAGIEWPVIIADSSTQPMNMIFEKNIDYSYTPGLTFTQKIEHVLDKVQSKYVVMCADDDFIVPGAIAECCAFLDENSGYSTAQGRCIKYTKLVNTKS